MISLSKFKCILIGAFAYEIKNLADENGITDAILHTHILQKIQPEYL